MAIQAVVAGEANVLITHLTFLYILLNIVRCFHRTHHKEGQTLDSFLYERIYVIYILPFILVKIFYEYLSTALR